MTGTEAIIPADILRALGNYMQKTLAVIVSSMDICTSIKVLF